MKRFAIIIAAAACALVLAACAPQTPTLDEVEKAVAEGNVTLEDALDKGWVTQEWADADLEEHSVAADDKVTDDALADFSTETVEGGAFAKGDIQGVTFLTFIDPEAEEGRAFFRELAAASDAVRQNGASIVVCARGDQGSELFDGAPFPVIVYNDELRAALGESAEMAEAGPATGVSQLNAAIVSLSFAAVPAHDVGETARQPTKQMPKTARRPSSPWGPDCHEESDGLPFGARPGHGGRRSRARRGCHCALQGNQPVLGVRWHWVARAGDASAGGRSNCSRRWLPTPSSRTSSRAPYTKAN